MKKEEIEAYLAEINRIEDPAKRKEKAMQWLLIEKDGEYLNKEILDDKIISVDDAMELLQYKLESLLDDEDE